MNFRGTFLFATLSFLAWPSLAAPPALTYQGRILKSDGTALEYNNVGFIFQITDPTGSCVIYEEQVSGFDMSNSGGVFDSAIGAGSRSFPTTGTSTVLDSFSNAALLNCQGGSTYTPSIDDGRKLRVRFYDGTGWKLVSPDNVIRSVPYAGYASSSAKLGTNVATDFILKNSVNGGVTCDSGNFLTWNASTLSFGCAAVSGTGGGTLTGITSSNSYLSISNAAPASPALTLNVGTVANTVAAGDDSRLVNAMQSGASAGGDLSGTYPNPTVSKINNIGLSYSSIASGQFLKYNGTNWINASLAISDISGLSTSLSGFVTQTQFPASCTASQTLTFISPSGSFTCSAIGIAGSQVSGNIAGNAAGFTGSLAGDVSGAQATTSVDKIKGYGISFSTAPVSGNYLKYDGSNWVPSTLASADLPTGTLTGAGTAGYVPYYSATSTLADSPIFISSSHVGIGTTSAGVALQVNGTSGATLKIVDGNQGLNKVLTSDANGVASWATPSASGTVTAVTATAPVVSSGGTTPVISMAAATTTMDGYLSSSDWNIFSGKAPLASPAFTGTPIAPTATLNTNTTQLATTAFVLGQASTTTPLMDGTAAVGTGTTFARADHVHPTDTSRAPAAGSTSVTTLGTITTGTWNGSIVPVLYGGTGTANGSITGTGALGFTAGGTNQNVTLTPSGSGSTILNGNVGIGTATPGTSLQINGSSGATLKIVDGNQGVNKVLTSDANGVASWANAPSGTDVSFSVSKSTDQAITVNVANSAGFDTITYDTTSAYSTTSKKFQPTVAGKYFISFTGNFTGLTTNAVGTVSILKNGTVALSSYVYQSSNQMALNTNGVVSLNGTTDYITFTALVNGTSGTLAASDTSAQGYLISSATVASGGSGTSGYIPLWSNSSTLGNSPITISGSNVGIGTASPGQALSVNGTIESTLGGVKFPDGSTQTTAMASSFCTAYRTTSLSFAAISTWYDVPLTSEQSKSGITHSTSTNPERLQVPATGVYQITYTANFDAGTSQGTPRTRLFKNGTTEIAGTYISLGVQSGFTIAGTMTTIVSLNANDYVTLQAGINVAGITLGTRTTDAPNPSSYTTASVTILRLQ